MLAGTILAQKFPGINTRVMTIIPDCLDRIISDWMKSDKLRAFGGCGQRLCWVMMQKKVFPRTSSARANSSKMVKREICLMIIVPNDHERIGRDFFYTYWAQNRSNSINTSRQHKEDTKMLGDKQKRIV
jgi:hypothetical protein